MAAKRHRFFFAVAVSHLIQDLCHFSTLITGRTVQRLPVVIGIVPVCPALAGSGKLSIVPLPGESASTSIDVAPARAVLPAHLTDRVAVGVELPHADNTIESASRAGHAKRMNILHKMLE
jgi:hypothetical protein